MSQLHENKPVEAKVTEWLTQLGWDYCSADDLKVYGRLQMNAVIKPILVEQVMKLNGISQQAANVAVDILLNNLRNAIPIEGNEAFVNQLVDGVTVTIDRHDRTIRFINFDDIWQNSLIVTNQYVVQQVRTDICLLVNGIPLVPIEAKQCARRGTNWLEGVRQFQTYKQRSDKLFMCHVFGVACNGRLSKYGIPGASASYFNEWKDSLIATKYDNPLLHPENNLCRVYQDEADGLMHFDVERLPNGQLLEQMKFGIIGLLQPERVLDILQHFIVFERDNGNIIKKVARYQQLRAANKIVKRVVQSEKAQGVIWHTQGSGKSLTMLYTAYKLRKTEALNDPTIFLVVDRKDLKDQMGDTFFACEFPNANIVMNIGDLKSILKNKPAGVFITTIQKFSELGEIKDERDNVIVLIDEAHRTEYGDYQMELRAVLPNAKRFAFTGTPIPKTHQEFGVKGENGKYEYYLDKYSVIDAINDGATKPIRYTLGPSQWFLDKDSLKEGYDEITAELNDDQKRLVEQRVKPWKTLMKKPERIKTLAADIAKDFRERLEPQGFKAQVVAIDKEACVLYYNELLNYFDKSEIRIIFSTGQYETSERYDMFSPFYIDDKERKRLIDNFKKRITDEEIAKGNNLKIFIVCNMLLTGFDAPIEQTMYLDSPLRDHNLLQAVARTNRPYDYGVGENRLSKEFGRIVDYVGVFQNYKDALNYDPEDIGEFEDVDALLEVFPKELDKAFAPFAEIKLEDSYECQMAIIRKLSEIDHGQFENSFHRVVQLWEAICPNPGLRPFRTKYLWFVTIYELYLEEFRRIDFDAEFFAAQTRKLLEESATMLDFRGHLPEIVIDADYLTKLQETRLSPSDKAEKIIRDIETMIRTNQNNSAIYIEFQERLDALIRMKNANAIEIEGLLKKLSELYTEVDEAVEIPKKMGFEDKGTFEIYQILKNELQDFDEELAREFANKLAEKIKQRIYIGWQEISREYNDMRHDVELFCANEKYDALNVYGKDALYDSLMDSIVRNFSLN
ncbi:MAG: HsdR family type I site-specific deoxyribonuclease [Salinivirgaceae bacterium]|nr:HsdR family type I site-specific deoxyribonuclease [Salinivirgaceae bacterium]